MEHRAGFVNILGRPNVGKSTLLNAMMGEKMVIVTSKPQTTRHRILGIINEEAYQIVFSDTPGIIHDPAYSMQKSLNRFAFSSLEDADILLFMTDPYDPLDNDFFEQINNINSLDCVKFLILNKMDQCDEERANEIIEWWKSRLNFDSEFRISALKKEGTEELMDEVIQKLPVHPPFYPKDQLSDRPERFFVSEIIREEILLQYKKEVPYACEVEILSFKEDEKITRISAIIHVARNSQKPILIGRKGSAIKQLGIESRKKIEAFLDTKIYLELSVKVKKNWRNDERMLKYFGYQ
jgi:GTP-binding protein Era